MTTANNAATKFQLNWIRESTPNNLESDFGTPVEESQLELALLGLLPEQQVGKPSTPFTPEAFARLLETWRQPQYCPVWAYHRITNFFDGAPDRTGLDLIKGVCDRIREQARSSPGQLHQLHLPPWSRRHWRARFENLAAMQFQTCRDGIRATGVEEESVRHLALEIAASSYGQQIPNRMIHCTVDHPVSSPWSDALIERYGLEIPLPASFERFDFEMPAQLMHVFKNSPRERHCHYYLVFSRVAVAIQSSLRRWILAAYCDSLDRICDFDNCSDVLVYAAIKPYSDKCRQQFSYDVLDGELMETSFSRAIRRVEPLLKTTAKVLKDAGREDDQSQFVRSDLRRLAARVADRAYRRKRVRGMLVSEGVLVDSVLKFCNRLKSLRTAIEVNTAAEDLTSDFIERLRKLFFFSDRPEQFAAPLLLEAANAIHSTLDAEQQLEILATDSAGSVHCSRRSVTEPVSLV